jgi:alkylation response protein AidB-like acyl-CoA dehydrogenase
MDFNLSEQEKMLQSLARDFADKVVLPRAAEIDRSARFPADLASEIGSRGFQGLPYPPEYGGSGAGYTSYALVMEQLCRASMTVGAIMAVNTVPEEALFRFGTEEQKKRLLTPLAKGERLGGIGFTESETGSDPRAITTMARRRGDGYVINGQKQFMALAPALDVSLVFARWEGEGLSAFIVEASSPGFGGWGLPLSTSMTSSYRRRTASARRVRASISCWTPSAWSASAWRCRGWGWPRRRWSSRWTMPGSERPWAGR